VAQQLRQAALHVDGAIEAKESNVLKRQLNINEQTKLN